MLGVLLLENYTLPYFFSKMKSIALSYVVSMSLWEKVPCFVSSEIFLRIDNT